LGSDALAGVTVIAVSAASETVSVVLPVVAPRVALMLTGPPFFTACARPWEPAALLTVAIVASEDAQVTCVVRSWWLLSENVPVAVYCCSRPCGSVASAGVTAIDVSVMFFTVSVLEPCSEPCLAMIVVVPAFAPDARPFEPVALLIVAVSVLVEIYVT